MIESPQCRTRPIGNERLIKLLVLLSMIPGSWSTENYINIILKPRDWEDPTKADGYLCGVNSELETSHLLAELNPSFIFEHIDRTHDVTPDYRTTVFDLVAFNNNDQPQQMLDMLPCSMVNKEPGLFTVFLAPPTMQCNRLTFEDVANEINGYYHLAVLDSNDFAEIMEDFISKAQTYRNLYNGKLPKICATGLKMSNTAAHSRKNELTFLFNFAFNEKRNVDTMIWKMCKTADETLNSIMKSSFYDVTSEINFKDERQTVKEMDQFAKVVIIKKSSTCQKTLGFVTSEFPTNSDNCRPASEKDIVPLSNLVIFNEGEKETEVIIRVKQDDEVEDAECFYLHIKDLTELQNHKRIRRMPKKIGKKETKKEKEMTIDADEAKKREKEIFEEFKNSFQSYEIEERDCLKQSECADKGYQHCWTVAPNDDDVATIPGICVYCIQDLHCTKDDDGLKCSPKTKECVECVGNDDCESEDVYCHNEKCDVCNNKYCEEENLYTKSHHCKSSVGCVECMDDDHCGGNMFCKGKDVQETETKCVECKEDSNCQSIFYPKCDNEGKCQPCSKDGDCSNPELKYCWMTEVIDKFCAECIENKHCPNLQQCIKGKCMKRNPHELHFIDAEGKWRFGPSKTKIVNFYTLIAKDAPSYSKRCPLKQNKEDHTQEDTLKLSPNTWHSDELTQCSLRILELLLTRYGVQKKIGSFWAQVLAIAIVKGDNQIDYPELYIAGNLDESLLQRGDPEKRKERIDDILFILDHKKIPYRKVFALNPDAITGGKDDTGRSLSRNHAEMQIISYIDAFNMKNPNKKKEIISFHITKPPCCACNSVIDKSLKFTPLPRDTIQAQAYSASNSQDLLCKDGQLCGSQFPGGSDNFGTYWNHPNTFSVTSEQLFGPED